MKRLLAFAAWLAVAAAPAMSHPWSLSDTERVRQITSVEASSDGTILFGVLSANARHDSFDDDYFVRSTDGATRPLLRGQGAVAAHWSSDGHRLLAVIPAHGGGSRILVLEARSLRVVRSIRSPRVVSNVAWSPDDRTIAAVETQPRGDAGAVSVWLEPQTDALGRRPPQRQLWLISLASGTERRLVQDAFSYGGPVTDVDPSWSPDGRNILVMRQPTPAYGDYERAQPVSVDVRTGSVTPVASPQPFSLPGTISPQFSSGRHVLTVHTWDGSFAAREDLFVDGRDVSAHFDHDFWSCGFAMARWDGDALLATTMDGVDLRLYRFAGGGAPVPLTPAGGSVHGLSAWRHGIVVAYSTPDKPDELYALDRSGGLHQLSHLNELPPSLDVAATRLIHWDGPAKHTLVGQLTMPSRPVALLTEPHGGPQCADDSSFSPLVQYFATNGYAYFRPSVRGSDGYGDWSYKTIRNDFGPGPLDDLVHGVDAATAAAAAPPGASFLYGASYGGYLTAFAVTHTDRFRAAVAAIPVTDVSLDYLLSESPNITRRFFGRTPLIDNESAMQAQSPVTFAARLRTPLLLMMGLRDTRAPYAQTLAFYRRLVELGKDVRLLAYPSEGHGPSTPRALEDWAAHVAGWFAAHGGPHAPGALAPP